jgi:RecA-family ATPase
MIGIASSANVFAGNELDRSQVQQFVALLTRVAMVAGGGLVLISHPSLTGISSGSGISGSTQWHNAVRARFYIKGVKPGEGEEPDGNLREIEFKKNNYGPVSETIGVRYENGLFLPITATTLDKAARDQQAEEIYLIVLKKLIDQRQDLGLSKNASNYAPAMIAKHPLAAGFRKAELEEAQQRLFDRDAIHIKTVGPPSKERKYLAIGRAPF